MRVKTAAVKQVQLVGEPFIIIKFFKTTHYSYIVDVLVSDRHRNVNNVRIMGLI